MRPSELRAHLRAALAECKAAQPALAVHWAACLSDVLAEPEEDLLFFTKYFRHVARQLRGRSTTYGHPHPLAESGDIAGINSAPLIGTTIASDADKAGAT